MHVHYYLSCLLFPFVDALLPYGQKHKTGCFLFLSQFLGLFVKRVLYSVRRKPVTMAQIILPILFTFIGCMAVNPSIFGLPDRRNNTSNNTSHIRNTISEPPRSLSFDMYGDPVVSAVCKDRVHILIMSITPNEISNAVINELFQIPYAVQQYGSKVLHDSVKRQPTAILHDVINKEAIREQVPTVGKDVVDAMDSYLIQKSKQAHDMHVRNYMVAATFNGDNSPQNAVFTGWFNNEVYHSPGVTLSLVDNMMLDYFVPESDHNIHVTNHPLPNIVRPMQVGNESGPQYELAVPLINLDRERIRKASSGSFTLSYTVNLGMVFNFATFVLFLVKEREVRAKHCQLLAGVSPFTFWAATFTWDFINFAITVVLVIAMFSLLNYVHFFQGINIM